MVALALVLLFLALPAATAEASSRIVGGQPTAASDLPYMAGLEIAVEGSGDDSPDALCAGSLIAARWVLTAAHCLAEQPVDVDSSAAIIGATNLDAATPEQTYAWAQAIPSPDYATGRGGSDVGLIRLARPAAGQQLRLLRPADAGLFEGGDAALTAGWGFTEDPQDGGTLSTNQLRSVDLSVVADLECERSFADAGQGDALQFDTEICAIAPGKDSCNGDSGGPLVVADAGGLPALAGAVSFGIGSGDVLRGSRSCNEGPPGVYARVGGDSLNAFVRRHVPQVEIDTGVATPVAGQPVTLTASPSAPGGDGPFGGYDALSWDLDGDGAFGERAGRRSATVTLGGGATTVAVLATTTDGDAEVRTLRLVGAAKSAVSFTRARKSVRGGRTVAIRVARVGTGAGAATVAVRGKGVTPRRRTLRFTGDEAARTLRVRARRTGRARTATLRLRSFTGEVVAGARTKLRLRVRPQR